MQPFGFGLCRVGGGFHLVPTASDQMGIRIQFPAVAVGGVVRTTLSTPRVTPQGLGHSPPVAGSRCKLGLGRRHPRSLQEAGLGLRPQHPTAHPGVSLSYPTEPSPIPSDGQTDGAGRSEDTPRPVCAGPGRATEAQLGGAGGRMWHLCRAALPPKKGKQALGDEAGSTACPSKAHWSLRPSRARSYVGGRVRRWG